MTSNLFIISITMMLFQAEIWILTEPFFLVKNSEAPHPQEGPFVRTHSSELIEEPPGHASGEQNVSNGARRE